MRSVVPPVAGCLTESKQLIRRRAIDTNHRGFQTYLTTIWLSLRDLLLARLFDFDFDMVLSRFFLADDGVEDDTDLAFFNDVVNSSSCDSSESLSAV
jgi:hypothetical protein